MDTGKIIQSSLKELGIEFKEKQISLLINYLELIYAYNKHLNLIGTKDKKNILIRHFLDCVSILKYKKVLFGYEHKCNRILDVGTGAGLPGMLLAIFLENDSFYLLDKKLRKINILKKVVGELSLSNVELIRGKAEELAHSSIYREKFDLVLTRALAKFNVASELVIPFCKINGKIIFYKGKRIFKELNSFGDVISKLGGKVYRLQQIAVPNLNEFRILLIVLKGESSPCEYPRSITKIKKIPLV